MEVYRHHTTRNVNAQWLHYSEDPSAGPMQATLLRGDLANGQESQILEHDSASKSMPEDMGDRLCRAYI